MTDWHLPGADAGDALVGHPSIPTRHAELLALVESLRQHEEELEVQNDQLRAVESELAASRRRYRDLFAGSPVAKVSMDNDNVICEANAAMGTLLGVTPEALAEQPLNRFIHYEDREGLGRALDRLHAGAPRVSASLRVRTRDSDGVRAVTFIATRADDDQVMGVMLDVTRELRLAENVVDSSRELDRAHQQLTGIVDAMADALIVLSPIGRITRVNPALCELLGYAPDELLDRPIGFILEDAPAPPSMLGGDVSGRPTRPALLDDSQITRFVDTHVVGRSRKFLLTVDGERVPVVLTGARVKSAETGALERVVCVARDVREDVQRERQLRMMVEAAPIAEILLDDKGRVVGANAKAEELFGYTRAELMGRAAAELVPDRSDPDGPTGYLEHLGGPRLAEGRDVVGVRKDGRELPLGAGVAPITTQEGRRLLVALVDLSERKRFEEAARQAQKMEAVGTLASGVAHDVNNLLMGIGGCARIALAELPAGSSASMLLEEIVQAVDSGAGISRQLVEFSRRGDVNRQRFTIDGLLEHQSVLWARLLGESIELVVAPGAPKARVHAVRVQLEQVLMNLVINARDAMIDGGRLTISSAEEELGTDQLPGVASGLYVRIDVDDTGVGISPDSRERIFEPFFTTKPVGTGTGLGLAMAYATLQRTRGHIEAMPRAEGGTRFSVWVPVADHEEEPAAPPAPLPAPAPAAAPPLTVLLVEDEAAARLATRFYLQNAGCHVLEARSSEEALECAREYRGKLDLLLTDVVMPGRCGDEVAVEVLRLRPDTTVVFMSAHPRELLVERGRLSEDATLLNKPFDEAALREVLRDSRRDADD